MLELLAPTGGPDGVAAAVQNGANAIYLGYGAFNARRNATNFTKDDLQKAIAYCHLRDVKVYLTLNTLLTDRELGEGASLVSEFNHMGVDALIVQDLGVAKMVKEVTPYLPIHGSTQMTVHNLDGVNQCADWGMDRIVLSREIPRKELEHICAHSTIELEVFGHGALCMCYSGQCLFSSVIGGRSGNRGLCAQPCRLPYRWDSSQKEGYLMSLKDLSLAHHLQELDEMGVSCIKLEGRMKRPEYVAVVTQIFSTLIAEKRKPTHQEQRDLEQAFSREGFTDRLYTGEHSPDMMGVRSDKSEPKELFAAARRGYEGKENPRVPLHLSATMVADAPMQVTATDPSGHQATAVGEIPQAAINRAITEDAISDQLSRTGGTPFFVEHMEVQLAQGLSIPQSALNGLRRQVLEELSAQRVATPHRPLGQYTHPKAQKNQKTTMAWTATFLKGTQVSKELLTLSPTAIYLPPEELTAHPEIFTWAKEADVTLGAICPRISFDSQNQGWMESLEGLKAQGLTEVLVGHFGQIAPLKAMGLTLRGDLGVPVYNSETLADLAKEGLSSATLSFELKFPQIRDIQKAIPCEAVLYGHLPLMITETCLIKQQNGKCNCHKPQTLIDRKGETFPVVKAYGCRNEIFNGQPLFLGDKAKDYSQIGLSRGRLAFTVEDSDTCLAVAQRYFGGGTWSPDSFTRGLYYRDVE